MYDNLAHTRFVAVSFMSIDIKEKMNFIEK